MKLSIDAGQQDRTAQQAGEEWSFSDIVVALRRGKWTVIITAVIVLALTSLYTFLSDPVYEASALILVDTGGKPEADATFDVSGLGMIAKVMNELELLKSRTIAEMTARSLLRRAYLDSSKMTSPIQITLVKDPETGATRQAQPALVVERLSKCVEIVPIKESDLIKVSVRSNNPDEAALIANTITNEYTENNLLNGRASTRALREFLQSQLAMKQVQLDSAEENLKHFMSTAGVVSLTDEAKKRVEQLAGLEAERDGLDVDIASREQTLAALRQEYTQQAPNVERAIGESNDAYIRLLQEQLARMEVQRDMAKSAADGSPDAAYPDKLREVDTQIAQIKQRLAARTQSLMGTLMPADRTNGNNEGGTGFLAQVKQRIIETGIELDGLRAKRKALASVIAGSEREFDRIPAKNIDMARLQRARVSSEKLYLMLEDKFNETAIAEHSEQGRVHPVDVALPPGKPVSPHPLINHLVGLLVGLVLGVVVVLARSRIDDRVRSPEDLKKIHLEPIGIIQRMHLGNVQPASDQRNFSDGGRLDWHLVTALNPLSPVAENYRQLRTAIRDSVRPMDSCVLSITSPTPGEGKTTTAVNLAASFAQLEGKILLIDADLRQPKVHAMFGLAKEPGLSDILSCRGSFDAVVRRGTLRNLDVLCSGTESRNPAELLESQYLAELLAAVRPLYSIVVIDAPPVLAVADAAILARQTEGMILVARAGLTSARVFQHALTVLKKHEHRLLGVVLNGFDLKQAYGSYRYGLHTAYGYYGNTKQLKMKRA